MRPPNVQGVSERIARHVRHYSLVIAHKPLVPAHVQSIALRSILALTLLAYMRAGQPERRVSPAPIRIPEWSSRLSSQRQSLFTQPRGTTEHRSEDCIFPNTFSCLIYPSLLRVCHAYEGSSKCHQATGQEFTTGHAFDWTRASVVGNGSTKLTLGFIEAWNTTPTCVNQCTTKDPCYKALRE